MTQLTTLVVADNRVVDLSPLSGLIHLDRLDLHRNAITDVSPLLANAGLGEGDVVDLSYNPVERRSRDQDVASLRARGVEVALTEQDDDEFPLSPLTSVYDDRVLAAHWPWYYQTREERESVRREQGRDEYERRRWALFRGFYTYFADEFDFLVLFLMRKQRPYFHRMARES